MTVQRRFVSAHDNEMPARPGSWCGQRIVKSGLRGLGGGEVGIQHDAARLGVGVSLCAAGDALALDRPALTGEVVSHGVENPGGVLARERTGEVGRVARLGVDEVGLPHVEHRHGEEHRAALLLLLAGRRVLDRLAHVAPAVDADAAFAFAYLAVELLPRPVTGDVGRLGALSEDQQQVVDAVAVECLREVQEPRPRLGLAQRLDLIRDLGLQLVGLGATLLGGLGVLDGACHVRNLSCR
jgi:hypothetical protein